MSLGFHSIVCNKPRGRGRGNRKKGNTRHNTWGVRGSAGGGKEKKGGLQKGKKPESIAFPHPYTSPICGTSEGEEKKEEEKGERGKEKVVGRPCPITFAKV